MITKETDLIERLERLEAEFGFSNFKRALQEIAKRRLTVSQRAKRKRFPWSKYQRLYQSQRATCPLCKEPMVLLRGEVEIDHKDPNRDEDFNDDSNLQLTHRRCNRSKSSRSIYEQAKKARKTIIQCL